MTLRRPRYIGATDVFMAQLLQATTNPHQAKPLAEVERDQWRERARQLQEMVDRVQKATLGHASVLHVDQRRATVRLGNNIAIADLPSDLEVREGDVILVTAEGNICGIAGEMPRTGNVFTVKRILPGPAVEVSAPGMPGKSVIVCREDLKATLQVGDHVLITLDGTCMTHRLPPEPSKMEWGEPTGVRWEDVGGCKEAKRALLEAIVYPYRHAAAYARHGHKPAKGVLLYGDPGNGKTLLGKAAATALAEEHGRDKGGFIYVKGPEILDKFVGASEGAVRQIFVSARQHKREHGFPPIVFVDEADAIFSRRGGQAGVRGMEQTIVPQFLAEMDGLDESSALVILATNRPEALDPAVVRDGRCDRRVHVGAPTKDDAREILTMCLERRQVEQPPSELADLTVREVWADRQPLYMLRSKSGKDRRLGVSQFVSGALLVGIVARAAAKAVRREVEQGEPSHLTAGDLEEAVAETTEELRAIDHTAAVSRCAREMGQDLERVEPVA